MNVIFQSGNSKQKSANVEWYTPPEIIHALGTFDLDPATSREAMLLNQSASRFYTKEDNGLIKEWNGRVWLNPPYQNPDVGLFMKKIIRTRQRNRAGV